MADDPCNPESSVAAATSSFGGAVSADKGENLRQLVEAVGPLPWPVVRWIALQLADALEPLHVQGRAHGALTSESIHLTRPWPFHQVMLGESSSTAATRQDDLRELGATLGWLLFGKEFPEDLPPDSDPGAKLILSAFSENRISSAGALNELLINGLLDSLPPEGAGMTESIPHTATIPPFKPQEAGSIVKSPPVGKRSALPKFAAVAALFALMVTGGYFLYPKIPANVDSTKQEQTEKEKEKKELERAETERSAREKVATENAEKENAARVQVEKEQAAREQAAREHQAKQAAREQTAREKAIRDDTLVSQNEKILKNPEVPASEKERAFSEILPLATEGHVKAIELCGASYWQGNGVPKNKAEARRWFERGVQAGNARSMLGLGNCYEQAIGGPRDMIKAAEFWKNAADAGEPLAMSRLGEYLNSDPQAKDVRQAMEWWQKAADLGVPEAMTNLGILYDAGSGGASNPSKAIELWEKAATLGEPRAKTELGYMYFNGKVRGKSAADAFPLFIEAAKADDPRAMTGLGACYYNGSGTKTDKPQALEWLRRAADRREQTALDFLEKLKDPGR